MNRLATLTLAAMLLNITACSKHAEQTAADSSASTMPPAAVKQGIGLGKVVSFDNTLHTVTLAHNDIPGIMEAMSMEYTLAKPELMRGLAAGDSVRFTLQEPATGTFIVSDMEKLRK